jgi:uncharacterized membrane protein YhaH (DUF805 family)
MIKLIPKPLRQYAQFQGRMDRSRFLRWIALSLLILYICAWIDLQFIAPALGYLPFEDVEERYLMTIAAIGLAVPWLASNMRRLHDVNRSGWWMLFAIPMIMIVYFGTDIGLAIYEFFTSGPFSDKMPKGIGELALRWMPYLIYGLAALSFSPVIYWGLKKGSGEPNRFGERG